MTDTTRNRVAWGLAIGAMAIVTVWAVPAVLGVTDHQPQLALGIFLAAIAFGVLADKGLPAALEAPARKSPVPVSVDAGGVGRYENEIEVTVYFCTLEALNNVAKYAEASNVRIWLAQADGHLNFEVIDDGSEFDPARTEYGTGLQGMTDRLDAVGGSVRVESAPGRGTTVPGNVPVAAASPEGVPA